MRCHLILLGLLLMWTPVSSFAENRYQDSASIMLAGFPIPDIRLPDIGRIPIPRPSSMAIHWHWYLPFHALGFRGGNFIAPNASGKTRPAMGFVSTGNFTITPMTRFSLEMDMLGTNSILPLAPNSGEDEWSAWSFGFYAAFRLGDPIYFKIKSGWALSNMEWYEQQALRRDSSDSIPLGMAVGWRIGNGHVMELEAVYLEDDLSMVTFAFIF